MVTGLSGSGKTAALKALEDIGFFCVDNLPAALLPKFVELSIFSGEMVNKVGIGMDSREKSFLEMHAEVFDVVASMGIGIEVLFLEADDDILIRRFSETRRLHPLARDRSVPEGILEERKLLKGLRQRADLVVDTTSMSVHELKKTIWAYFENPGDDQKMQINLESFGFRNGIPPQADMVLDVRFLPNPYFVPELKEKTGELKEIREFVLKNETGAEFMSRLMNLLAYMVPLYEKEGKRYLTLAVGCTGGRHRSVAVVRELERMLAGDKRVVRVVHRDIGKGRTAPA